VAPEPMPLKDVLEASVAALKLRRRTTRANTKVEEPAAPQPIPIPIPIPMLDERPQTMAEILRANGLIPALN
jgi:hypothetical protein